MEQGSIRFLDRGIVISSMLLSTFARPQLSMFIQGCELSRMENREAVMAYLRFWVNVLKPVPTLPPAPLAFAAETPVS